MYDEQMLILRTCKHLRIHRVIEAGLSLKLARAAVSLRFNNQPLKILM